MTQPDESQPDGAISGTGLAAFAKKSQADWEAEQRNSMSTAWSGAEDGFYQIVTQIPIIGDIVEIITGKEDGDLNDLATWVNNITRGVRTALTDIGTIIAGIGGTIARDVGNFVNKVWTGVVDTWNSFWGGVFGTARPTNKTPSDVRTAASALSTTANTASATASTAVTGVADTSRAIYNGYYGAGGSGVVSEVQTTVQAIRTKLDSGWEIDVLDTSGTWTRPWTPGGTDEPKEFWALCFGSGGGGGAGAYSTSGSATPAGGAGGVGGSYAALQIDPADITATVSYTIATGGSGATTNGGAATSGAQTSFGSYITTLSGRAFVSSLFGYYTADDSQPGAGGSGANFASPTSALAGGSTPLAAGGAAGVNPDPINSIDSSAGSNGSSATQTGTARAGGGGGGGGGRGQTSSFNPSYTAKKGGNGGWPGGGGGGGGAMRNASSAASPYNVAGHGGNGAAGGIILLWK